MKNILLSLSFLAIFVVSCKNAKQEKMENPLLITFDTPFQVPPFEKIKPEHYEPAIDSAIGMARTEIEAIAGNPSEATFENTVEAIAYSGNLLTEVSSVFFNMNEANTNDTLQNIANKVSPKITAFYDEIFMNGKLFSRVSSVYAKKESLKLNAEQKTLLEYINRSFIRSGVNLPAEQQERLKKINSELSLLSLKFGQNVLAENNWYKLIVDQKDDLAGLPQTVIDAAYDVAKENNMEGKWVFTLHNPSVMPFLQYASNRDLRKQLQQAYINRGNNNDSLDNKKIIAEILQLRIEKARLLDYNNHSEYVLTENMAQNPKRVFDLLNRLWKATLPVAQREVTELQGIINSEGGNFKLEAWDWRYYAEKQRKLKYDLDEEQVKPYFKLDNVLDGIFTVSNKLFGLNFKELKDIPVYHPDVTAYQVTDQNGNHQGILYLDMHPRASKRGGAWMTTFRSEHKKASQKIYPVVSIVCNFSKPAGNTPSLLTFDEVSTFFHEFGHGLNYLLHDVTYPGLPVPPDFVELPSQIMENWAVQPEVLNIFARHYQTGEVIPNEIVEKIAKSGHFNQGFATSEYLAASFLDMSYHTLQEMPENFDVLDFEKQTLDQLGLVPEIISRYRSTYFQHIFSGGYSSGYYGYIWAEMLDADAFNAFREKGLFDQETASAFRDNVLAKSGADDLLKLYIQFRGKEPVIEPLLKKRGLN
jgi:peptidyl-dipeptidase Dcp